jgi:hypothetical protein
MLQDLEDERSKIWVGREEYCCWRISLQDCQVEDLGWGEEDRWKKNFEGWGRRLRICFRRFGFRFDLGRQEIWDGEKKGDNHHFGS